MDDHLIQGSKIHIGDNQVSLHNLVIGSGSVSEVSMKYHNITVWCDYNCPGAWYWGWCSIGKENIDFAAHICFDHPQDALMFKLCFKV